MKTAIFITNDHGPKTLWNPDGTIKLGQFVSQRDNLMMVQGRITPVGSATWVLALPNDTPKQQEIVNMVRAHPHFRKEFQNVGHVFYEVDAAPITGTVSNLRSIHDPNQKNTANKELDEAKVQLSQAQKEKAEYKEKMKRFAILSAMVQKAGGGILKDADPIEVAEFQKLKIEMEIEENEEVIS